MKVLLMIFLFYNHGQDSHIFTYPMTNWETCIQSAASLNTTVANFPVILFTICIEDLGEAV